MQGFARNYGRVFTAWGIAGITGDVADLKAQIEALQNSPGTISPEDQALLDGIQTRATALADKVTALDAVTPPPAPPA